MVEAVKLFLAAWTLKNIQTKLIHLLGGVSKEEAIKINHDSFYQGNMYGREVTKRYFIELEKQISPLAYLDNNLENEEKIEQNEIIEDMDENLSGIDRLRNLIKR